MYLCVCHTCGENAVFEDRERAQELFNEHAEQHHRVVLKRIDSGNEPVDTDADPDVEADTGAGPDSETGTEEDSSEARDRDAPTNGNGHGSD